MNLSSRFDFTASPWVFDLLTHLWQSTVVALALMVVIALGARLSARTRRTLGWIAIAKFALPAAWLAKLVERTGAAPRPWLTSDTLVLPVNFGPFPVADTSPTGLPVTVLLAVIWSVGAVGLLACWIARAVRVRRQILAQATPASEALAQHVERAGVRAGLRAMPRCVMVAAEHGPGLAGIVSPILILPRGLVERLGPAEFDSILIHECLHLRWRDNLWNAVRAVFVALFWFNPVAWLLNRVIGVETEKSCDERVIEITGDADAYANSIVDSVRHTLGLVRPGFSGATTPPVLGRIKAILAYPERRERPMVRRAVLLASIVLAALGGRAGSIAADAAKTAPAPSSAAGAIANPPVATGAVPADAVQPAAAKPARYKVGKITIKFVGSAAVTEKAVREILQIREGGEFDELILDRDIRAVYRTGWFEFAEVKYEPAEDGKFNLVFVLTSKPAVGTANPTPRVTSDPAAPATEPPSDPHIGELELNDAKRKLEEAKTRLQKLQAERAAALAQKKELDEAHSRAASVPGRIHVALPPPGPGPRDGWETRDPRSRLVAQESLAAAAAAGSAPAASRAPATLNGKPVYEIQALDRVPIARFQSRPQYPFDMRRAGISGEVVVDFIVDDQGEVMNAFAARSSRPEFEPAAVAVVSRWKYKPGVNNGANVHTHMQVPIVFTLD